MKATKPRQLFSRSHQADYRCGNCGNRIREECIIDFSKIMPDDKLTCPLCMSLEIRRVEK